MRRKDLGAPIESDILKGRVRVERSMQIDYPRFAYQPHGWKREIALANASSMIPELAPVVLYLRYMVVPGNVLIVEEPESHLHPAMQVELTRQLALLVEEGLRIIVTTHSEWLLEELGNIVQRSSLPNEKRSDSIALKRDQVGVWLFKRKNRSAGSVVEEIQIDESGSFPSDYSEVANALHNDWATIASSLENAQ